MSGNWPLGLIPAYILLVLSSGLLLYLFLMLKRETQKAFAQSRKHIAKLEAAVAALAEQAAGFESRLQRAEQAPRADASAPALPSQSALNLTRRSQAIQRSRQGEAPEQIASALGLPLSEVQLLLKVHRMVVAAL